MLLVQRDPGAGRASRRPRLTAIANCTIAHRTLGAAERCAETAKYRREEAREIARERQAIADHNASLARQAADRAERRAHRLVLRSKHAALLKVVPYLAAAALLALLGGGVYMAMFENHATLFVVACVVSFLVWLAWLGLRTDAGP
jgi:hypothetical protein